MFITVSGLDGAGKTTLISELSQALASRGLSVTRFSMYEDVGLYSAIRQFRRRRSGLRAHEAPQPAFRSEGAQRLIHGPLVASLLLPLDLALFRRQRRRVLNQADVLILDRYFYDSLVELRADEAWWGRLLLRLLPAPDVSVFVDAEPAVAFARKGEHGVPELSRRQLAYRKLIPPLPHAITIRNDVLDVAKQELLQSVCERLPR